MLVRAPVRDQDKWGAGQFGASRDGGKDTHNGIDFACWPGSTVLAVRAGTVTKLGHVYADDLSYRYVEVTDAEGRRWRYFYVEPGVDEGDAVDEGNELGTSQALGPRYKGITEHVHLEIKQGGDYLNPWETGLL